MSTEGMIVAEVLMSSSYSPNKKMFWLANMSRKLKSFICGDQKPKPSYDESNIY
jgi:hypothetical protein